MPHDTPLIATIVAGLGLAFIFGALANRFRIPPLVGYLVAGVLVGPNTPGFVADQQLALELAEIGVILLMFGVGLHFSLKDLLSVRAIAVPGAIVQIAFATVLGAGLAWLLGWTIGAGLVFGLALSVASTVVLLRALQERRLIETERGRIAVGWLIVEDLAMVLALVLLPALAGVLGGDSGRPRTPARACSSLPADLGIWGVLGITLAKVAAFVVVMLVVGRRVIPWILHYVAHTGSRELFRLAVLAIALGVAFGAAKLFGVSLALGAFFAGMIMSESELSHRAAEESLPLRDAFSVLFFVSVGMLFDPTSLLDNPLADPGHAVHHRHRQVGRRLPDRRRLPLSDRHGADDLGKPGADRRILLHPRRARRRPEPAARAGPRPDPRRRDPVDRPQPAGLRRRRPAEALAGEARRQRPTPTAKPLGPATEAGAGSGRGTGEDEDGPPPDQRSPATRSWSATAASAAWSASR